LAEYWLRGGFPDACRAEDGAAWTLWQENYLRTFVERDVARQGVRVAPAQMRRFMTMMAHYHGNLLNASEIGRSLGVSYHTAQSYLEVLERHFLLRRLPPLEANLKKRLVKSSKVYLRDTGLLHHLLDIANERGLLASPKRGSSWEGLMIEQLLARTQWEQPGGQAWFYRTQTGTEVDLVLPRGRRRVGYEFKSALAVHAEDAAPLRTALADGVIDEGWVVYLGQRRFPIGNHIEAIGAEELLSAAASRP
jgi:predicted AAA+ superfamily ATPase